MAIVKTRSTNEVKLSAEVTGLLVNAVKADNDRQSAEKSMFAYLRDAAQLASEQFEAKLGLVDGVDKLAMAYNEAMDNRGKLRSIFKDCLILFCAGDKSVTITKQAKGSEPEAVKATEAAKLAKHDVASAATALRADLGISGNKKGAKVATKAVAVKTAKLSDDALIQLISDRMGSVKFAAKLCDAIRAHGYDVTKTRPKPTPKASLAATVKLRK